MGQNIKVLTVSRPSVLYTGLSHAVSFLSVALIVFRKAETLISFSFSSRLNQRVLLIVDRRVPLYYFYQDTKSFCFYSICLMAIKADELLVVIKI